MAGNVAREFWMDFTELGDFVHGGLVDFFLGVEASAHGPFVDEMEERAGFVRRMDLALAEDRARFPAPRRDRGVDFLRPRRRGWRGRRLP